jgi:hypothetical protein
MMPVGQPPIIPKCWYGHAFRSMVYLGVFPGSHTLPALLHGIATPILVVWECQDTIIPPISGSLI